MSHFVNASQAEIKQYVERIERLEEEKASISSDIRDIFAQAKSQGYDVKVLRKVISLRKLNPQELTEQQELLDLYLSALGMSGPLADGASEGEA